LKVLKETSKENASGGNTKITYQINDILDDKSIKTLTNAIKNQKFKVQTQIQGSEIRIKSKDIDELQKVITHLKTLELEIALCFNNFS
ncbi:MAG: nucleotide-binding protein, partial [Helicobacter apodemus]|nr:nucleotide-binding protein [Helicobacter apodemus]